MIVVIIVSLLTAAALVHRGYFPMHDDLQVMRIWELEKCFADGQIPCRFVPDMNFGFGQAMFNFYSALPYYLGVLLRLILPISILDTVKLLFAISLVAGAVGVYLLGKEFFGKAGAIAAAVLYALAPYRAVNVYVRGAMAESFSLAILPFLWLAIYKIIKEPSYKHLVFMVVALAALLTTHNISTLIYFGFTLVWVAFWLFQNFKLKSVVNLFLAASLAVSLAGFFIIPVVFERGLIQSEIFTSDYSNYLGHFVSLKQLFISRFWGYGGSVFGEDDSMSFQVGWPHWWVAILAGIYAAAGILSRERKKSLMVLGLLALSLFSLFMTHNKSTFLWLNIPVVAYVQFPWRFLGIALFLISFASAGIFVGRGKLFKAIFLPVVVVAAVVLNINYFRPERTYDWLTDELKLSGQDFSVQQTAAALDYLPRTVKSPPLDFAPDKPVLVEGDAELPNLTKTSSTFFFDANVYNDSIVDVPIIYFPEWEVYLLEGRGRPISVWPSDNEGKIRLRLPPGKHIVYGRFVNTWPRTVGNALTLAAFFALLGGAIVVNNKRKLLGVG